MSTDAALLHNFIYLIIKQFRFVQLIQGGLRGVPIEGDGRDSR
jgi:hypothetical protein